eukprot:COSAG01_NODE_904_length_12843_cov_83.351146_5_plen_57_part_00
MPQMIKLFIHKEGHNSHAVKHISDRRLIDEWLVLAPCAGISRIRGPTLYIIICGCG